jgi:hypothetical protein
MSDHDPQDTAEDLDEDVVGTDDPILSDEARAAYPPDEPVGVPFADADVTDESFADRAAQEQPEVWQPRLVRNGRDDGADDGVDDDAPIEEQLGTIIPTRDEQPERFR